jgi:hypothetical protein
MEVKMFYKAIVWIILAVSAIFGGAYLANAQARTPNAPEREEIMNPVASAKSLQASRPLLRPFKTPTPTEVITASETLTPTLEVTPTPLFTNQGVYCSGLLERNHPVAERIAQEMGVSIDDIMKQFCVGHGFGEIELAYAIAAKSGIPVEEVFAKRDAGEGWGNIKKDYGVHGNPKKDVMKPGRGRQH